MTHQDQLLKSAYSDSLDENVKTLDALLDKSIDLIIRPLVLHKGKDIRARCYFTDGLVKALEIDTILTGLMAFTEDVFKEREELTGKELMERLLLNFSVRITHEIGEGITAILSGDTLLLVDGIGAGLIVGTRGWDMRSVSEPATETVVRGPRDGFTENIRTNTGIMRRRIRDPNLRIEGMQIGTRSKTDVNIAYIKDIAKEELVEEVRSRLKSIKIDAVLESGYIEELIEDSPKSIFVTIQSTERPDKVAAAILEGRVAVFVDNTPFVLVMPTYFWEYVQAADDYYSRYWVGSFFRQIRYFCFLLSLTLTPIYVMLVSFHHEMIPTELALTIASGRAVVPFPVLLEALMMEIAFELMREAGLRMPKPIGQAVSIVGSLIIGQAAVQAGLVSPFMVIVVAVTGIASFAIPNYPASFSIRLVRFPLIIAAGFFGLLGFAVFLFGFMIHALSLRSFGEPYLAPAAPFRPRDQKDLLARMPWWSYEKRPSMAQDRRRQPSGTKPKPPRPEPPQPT
ncbi:spore germination protein [Paenibacillus antri]|uniref:Spore germination protein n=1 Tax=Paenibacillus antri TaxID=2582848 RepID=A0A5R9GHM0_9BACL|nr:spore germination protein [Paenibacillus antri]TLS50965.1 spore germination protein [Paenibacillus antri]